MPPGTSADGDAPARRAPVPLARIEGRGYSVLPPAGEGWALIRRSAETVVFGKHRPEVRAQRGDGPYQLLAGVAVIPATADEAFSVAAPRWLKRRLQVPGRQLLTLEVRGVASHGATCLQYEALQADRYDFDEPTLRFEYVHHGRVCSDPNMSTRWIQVFASARSVRLEGPPAGWKDAQEFVDMALINAAVPSDGR